MEQSFLLIDLETRGLLSRPSSRGGDTLAEAVIACPILPSSHSMLLAIAVNSARILLDRAWMSSVIDGAGKSRS
jgi:hypothetical protein